MGRSDGVMGKGLLVGQVIAKGAQRPGHAGASGLLGDAKGGCNLAV